jgi:hypothetical protein
LNKFLHIVCLDAPSPPDYGGAIDMFYKVKSLAKLGVKVILHYFDYKHDRNAGELKEFCYEIITYKRKTGINGIALNKPYIVSSRINKQLIDNLNINNHPILFEGLHCTGVIPFLHTKNRKVMIRMHNDEAVYYNFLRLCERNWMKKAYYWIESKLLLNYQRKLPDFCTYIFISEFDRVMFKNVYTLKRSHFIPSFLPWQRSELLEGIGNYGLYHGNLSVIENERAAIWLINNIFSKVDYPFIIAGKNATRKLQIIVKRYPNVSLFNNPSSSKLDELIRNAHVHILPSLNQTGVKLKLLNAYFNGRFCITNKNGVQGSGLERACYIAENAHEYITLINALKQVPFTKKELEVRQKLLHIYDNELNARKIINLL